MSRKTRKLIWSAPLVAVLAVAGALAMFAAQGTGSVFANPLPAAPMNLTVDAADGDAGRTTLVLDWDAVANASGYRIDISNRGGVWETMTMDTGSAVTTYTDDTLSADDTRWYRVFAVNSHGIGPVSNAISGTTDDKVNPGSVMNLRATPNEKNPHTRLDLSWDAPAEDGGEMIVGYEIQAHRDGNWLPIGEDTATQVTVVTKTNYSDATAREAGDTQRYRVRAVNGTTKLTATAAGVSAGVSDDGDASEEWTQATGKTQAATAPGQVTGLTAVNTGAAEISLYWYDPEETGGWPISGYVIQAHRQGKKFSPAPSAATIKAATFGDTAPVLGGAADADNVDNATWYQTKPEAGVVQAAFPGILAVDHDGDTGDADATDPIQVKWHFRVYAVTTDNGVLEAVTDDVFRRSASASNTASDTPAARDIDHDGDADTAALDPLAPPALEATDGEDAKKQQIDLSVTVATALTGADPVVEQIAYRIDYSMNAGESWMLLERDTRFTGFGPDRDYKDDDGLGFDESRSYRVFAIGRHPYTDVGPAQTAVITGMTAASTVPDKPTGVMASSPSLRSIEASWTAPKDNGGQAIAKYLVQWVKDDGDDVAEAADFTTDTDSSLDDDMTDDAMMMGTFDISAADALDDDTLYVFRVAGVNMLNGTERPASATDATNVPKWSDPVLFNTTDAAKPTAVEGLTSEAATDTSGTVTGVNLLWNKPSDKIGITNYDIEVQDAEGDWANPEDGEDSPATRTSYTDPDEPEMDEMRKYRVRASNAAGHGPWTMVYYPRQPAMVHAPGKPTAVRAEKDPAAPTSQINVSWSAPADGASVTGYIIERRYAGDMMGDIPSDGYNAGVMGASHAFMDYKEWWETLNCKGMLAVAGSSASVTATEGESAQDTADRDMYCKHFANTAPTNMAFAGKTVSDDTAMKIKEMFMKRYVTNDMGKTMTMFTGMMYPDMGLMENTEYTYRIRAIHGMKAGVWSDTAMATTEVLDTSLKVPTNVMATSDDTGTLTLTWEGAENADFYILLAVDMSTVASGNVRYDRSRVNEGDARRGDVTGLNSGTRYLGIVVAVQGTGDATTVLHATGNIEAVR